MHPITTIKPRERVKVWDRCAFSTKTPDWLLRRPELNPTTKLVYWKLVSHAGRNLSAWPKQTRLAADLGLPERTVRHCLAQLEKQGLIEIVRRGRHQSNRYHFLEHPWMDDPSPTTGTTLTGNPLPVTIQTGNPLPVRGGQTGNPLPVQTGNPLPVLRKGSLEEISTRNDHPGREISISEIPSDQEVLDFAGQWPGEPATGAPPMPVSFVHHWLARMNGRTVGWPTNWRRALVASWREAFRSWQGQPTASGPGKAQAPPRQFFAADYSQPTSNL